MAKNVERKSVRVSRNPVTGQLESVALDAPQVAFEACTRAIENRLMGLSSADGHRLAAKLRLWLDRMVPFTDETGVAVPVVPHEERASE